MKLFNLYVLIFFSVLILTGCATQPKKVAKTNILSKRNYDLSQITLDKFEANVQIDEKSKAVISQVKLKKLISMTDDKGVLYKNLDKVFHQTEVISLKKAFLSSLEKINTPYFALINPGCSNLEGFPINNYKDFIAYLKPDIKYMSTKKQALLNSDLNFKSDEVLLILLPIDERKMEFIVWNTQKTKDELNKKD